MIKVHTRIKLLEECDTKPGWWHSRMLAQQDEITHLYVLPGRLEDEHEVEASLVQIASSRSIGLWFNKPKPTNPKQNITQQK